MVIFITTRNGYEELKSIALTGNYPVWIGGGVLDESEMKELREMNIELTNFISPVNPADTTEIEDALNTIAEHHPHQRIWLERLPQEDD